MVLWHKLKAVDLTSNIIQKYKSKSIPKLLERATHYFNKFIRLRDKGRPCIACSQFKTLQCGHYYPAGQYPMLKFNEDNCNGEDLQCNYFSGDHLITYRENLIRKIGIERVEKLDLIAKYNKRTPFKWSRIELIEIIETYKQKCKELS